MNAQHNNTAEELKRHIAAVPDFPEKGIIFRDITPLLADADAFAKATQLMADAARGCDIVAAVEARGFVFGAAVAAVLGVGVAAIRKAGKLPRQTCSASYALEYGESELHLHADAFAEFKNKKPRAAIVDDLLATGGTIAAAADIITAAGGEVSSIVCLIELCELNGRGKLPQAPFYAPLQY